ncbi:Kelch repeat-containing protein [Sulfobacillus harzensis]|uniref:Galactose oxidase n=1 Tax=Sulfobacillus harzensis TaxID=2729629 RepID=A0A7Y0L2I5_9FIRM|nr:kelch repeat-containing protein [Sulfobacillus harzensis]NMP22103.1 galactose oxidase [Sulfobacillus harzensis]
MSRRSRRPVGRFWLLLTVFFLVVISLMLTHKTGKPPVHRAALPPKHPTPVKPSPRWSGWSLSRLTLPHRTMGLAAVSGGQQVFVLGGLVNDSSSNQIVELQVSSAGAVQNVSPSPTTLPTPLHDLAAVPWDQSLLVLGGGTFASSAQTFRLPLPRMAPATPEQPLPLPLSDLAAVPDGARTLIVGGHNLGAPSNTIWSYSPGQPAHVFARLPQGVRYAAVARSAHTLYVVGGLTASGSYTNDAEAYNLKSGSMTSLPPYPLAMQYAEAAVVGGRLLVAGGQTASGWTSQAYWYNADLHRWQAAPSLPEPAGYGALVSTSAGQALWVGGEGPQGALNSLWTIRLQG